MANQGPKLTQVEIETAIGRLRKRISDLEAFNPSILTARNAPEVAALEASIGQTLADIFGQDTDDYKRYRAAAHFNAGPVRIGWVGSHRGGAPQDYAFREYFEQSRNKSIALLAQAISGLQERQQSPSAMIPVIALSEPTPLPRRVFIVHGHDEGPREAVARFLEKLGFEAIILHERPNKGRTLIAKFQEEAEDIGFAVVLMTADDEGAKAGEKVSPRARQNVIFEFGFFIGALGADRVAPLVAAGVERPSDYEGVVYISLEDDWKRSLGQELVAAGYDIDWNKVMA